MNSISMYKYVYAFILHNAYSNERRTYTRCININMYKQDVFSVSSSINGINYTAMSIVGSCVTFSGKSALRFFSALKCV